MKVGSTAIDGLKIVESNSITDARGVFSRLYCERELSQVIGLRRIVQVNRSVTTSVGAVRGLHFQYPPFDEMKLVRCLRGRIWDVAVDLRSASPTFLHWHAEELSAVNTRMMVIPEGFAHGFQVLEPSSEILYLHTNFYTASAEGGLRFDDPRLRIQWPLAVTGLSARDRQLPLIEIDFRGVNA
jgi:dTDP-4-dehydrorhamnose 3,5-epimerase